MYVHIHKYSNIQYVQMLLSAANDHRMKAVVGDYC